VEPGKKSRQGEYKMNVGATTRKSLRLRFLLLSACCFVQAFAGRSAFADASDCVEGDPGNRGGRSSPPPQSCVKPFAEFASFAEPRRS
jgi:hypothetical protein